jgi:hypothetical protein
MLFTGDAGEPSDTLLPGKAGGHGRGQENPRVHYLPDRGSDAGH